MLKKAHSFRLYTTITLFMVLFLDDGHLGYLGHLGHLRRDI